MQVAELITKHKLDPVKHWETIKVIREILNNENQDSLINLTPNTFVEEQNQPLPIDKMIPKFKKLFKEGEGHEILFSYKSNYGDDGGSLLLIYLLKPEYIKSYYESWDKDVLNSDTTPGFFHAMNHLIQHPEQCIEIWAGPY